MIVVSYIVPRLPVYVAVVDLWVFIYKVFFSVLFGKYTLNDEVLHVFRRIRRIFMG